MDIAQKLALLQKSRFRSSFHLSAAELKIIQEKRLEVFEKHAYEILLKRIKIRGENDGRQTPWKGHPVFVAQHATATCCRKCLQKWYGIPKEKELDEFELINFCKIILFWIKKEITNNS